MKKLVKKVVITVVLVFAVFGVSVSALAAAGYITWNGTEAYNSTLNTLTQIGEQGKKLKEEKERSNEQLTNTIKDKDNTINSLTQEIESLKKNSSTNTDQLKQAEIDMKDVDQKAKDALNKLK